MEFKKNEMVFPDAGKPNETNKDFAETDCKSVYASEIIDQAKIAAREMLENNESLRQLPIGWESGNLWLSDDKNLVIGTEMIDVDGKNYFIGLAKSEQ